MTTFVFGYGSLVLHESASMTLGRPAGELRPVRLHDWRRRFSQRSSRRSMKVPCLAAPARGLATRGFGVPSLSTAASVVLDGVIA